MNEKQQIIQIFREKVKGKKPILSSYNSLHDGKEGHWLEKQFGILRNANNSPDILGYELKKDTAKKTTFGDWSANEYIFTSTSFGNVFSSQSLEENRDRFLIMFGKFNEKKRRYSWSGEPCPRVEHYNRFGQILIVDESQDIYIEYDYQMDLRENKDNFVPQSFKSGKIELARWYGEQRGRTISGHGTTLKEKLENKFNILGWFKCKKDDDGIYQSILFGKPINYYNWLEWVRNGIVFFDSGMYQGNKRNYSQWRMNNNEWDNLIEETYT